jgi:hypothetical protein
MARRIDLRHEEITVNGATVTFDYADTMLAMLRTSPNGTGMSLDEVISVLAVMHPIENAIRAGKATVVLTEPQWTTLRDRLNTFRFTLAHSIIADFGMHIRSTPEIGTPPDEKSSG